MTDIALALGGGGARGLAHVHVLQAFDDLGVKPRIMAGSSIGAIMAAGYASGMTAEEIREHALKVFADPQEAMARLWKIRSRTFGGLFRESVPLLGELNAVRVMEAFLPEAVCKRFEELQIPLRLTATDYYRAKLVVLDKGPLIEAIAASAAIPAIFKPVMINERVLYDGGIMSPVPFDILGENGEVIIGVDVVGMPPGNDQTKFPTRLDAAFGAGQLMMQSIISMQIAVRPPHLLVRPRVGQYGVLDFLKTRTILEETAYLREEVKRDLGNLLDGKQKRIAVST